MMTGENLCSSDRLIAELIREHPGLNCYDELITDRNIHFFRHLSSLRETLLAWFPFEPHESVLEIGGGFGALTGVLSRKFGRVDVIETDPVRAEAIRLRYQDPEKIRVIESGIETYSAAKQYDAVILADLPEEPAGPIIPLLEKISSLLREDGVILLGFSNKDAVKYLCGGLDHHVSLPFDTSRLRSKKEVDSILQGMFPYIKWYYPMPDADFVQALYTDKSDFSTLADRIFIMDGYNSPYVSDEKQMLIEYARNGMIREHANYCLAEIRKQPKENHITEVYQSADREQGRRYQVTITEDTVTKSALDSLGIRSLEQEYRNNQALKARGIRVVDETFTDGVIRMPRINSISLLSYLGNVSSRDELESVFDKLYGNILLSSEETEKGVLKTGYIDMIPFNISCDDDSLIYYDQEFTVDNCETAYIMFRALHYTWLHFPDLEKIIPLNEMKQRYSISNQKWESCKKTEEDFISRNRRFRDLAQIRRWARWFPAEQLQKNRSSLLGFDPEALRAVQQVELDILRYFLGFCRQNGLSCFAMHGTLLGAVRNGGMIPWDDDIDVGMKREEFDRLVSLFDNNRHAPYFLQTMKNNRNIFFGGYARLRRKDTTMIEPYNRYHSGCLGIGIDIFPLDYCEEVYEKHIRKQRIISHLQRLLYAKRYPHNAGLTPDIPDRLISLYYILARFIPTRVLIFILEKCFRSKKRSSKRSSMACYYPYSENKCIFDDSDLSNLTELPFEDMMIPVMKNAEQYLIRRFGPNYMAEPKNRKPKHSSVFYDTKRSYHDFKG